MSSSIIEYPIDHGKDLIPLFGDEINLATILQSILTEKIGIIYSNDVENPTVALVCYDVLNFVAGDSNKIEAKELLPFIPFHKIIITSDDSWVQLLRNEWGNRFIEVKAPRKKFSSNSLDLSYIRTLKGSLPEEYRIAPISHENMLYFDKMMKDYIFSLFSTSEEFLRTGFGYCIMHDQKIICAAATSHPPVENAFEIQIVTRKEYRCQGLATIAAAYLIEYSLENRYDPRWDADNETSAKLAEKLGYSNPVPYKIYFRARLPVVILRKLKINHIIRIVLKIIGKSPE